MESMSSATPYAAMPAGGNNGAATGGVAGFQDTLSNAHGRVASRCTRTVKFLVLTTFSFVSFLFTCVSMGTPWLITTSTGGGTVTTKVTLTTWSTNACPPSGGCTSTSGTTSGTAKAAGDPVIGMLSLTLVAALYTFGVSLMTLLSLGRIGSGPLGRSKLVWLRNHFFAVAIITLACCIAYPATALPAATSVGFPGSNTYSVAYGGGFACALVSFLMMGPATLMVQAMVEEEEANGSVATGAGSAVPVTLPYAPHLDTSVYTAASTVTAADATKFAPYADAKVGGEYAAGGFQAAATY